MKQVGYGIIGAGDSAALHAKALSALKNAALVAVYDRNTAAAKRLAEEYGCEFCPDFRTFLADSRIQAVTIATPSGMHGAAAIPSAEAGKHVFCESRWISRLKRRMRSFKPATKTAFFFLPFSSPASHVRCNWSRTQ